MFTGGLTPTNTPISVLVGYILMRSYNTSFNASSLASINC